MKHTLTPTALLISSLAMGQMPYNPDANNDGQIGAYDLTSLLSVYSGSFSSGVLAEGTELADFQYYDNGIGLYDCDNDNATAYVVDLHQYASANSEPDGDITVLVDPLINGMTITLIVPGNFDALVSVQGINSDYGETFNGNDIARIRRIVFWNETWHRQE